MEQLSLKTFAKDEKPELSEIGTYLQERLHTTHPGKGITVSRDTLGNFIYESADKSEATQDEPYAATLVASLEGRELVLRNPGLLHQLANPSQNFTLVGKGSEASVYKVSLATETGESPFAVRYGFPVKGTKRDSYTPGIDYMSSMQYVSRKDPLPGLHYVVPVLATLDMTVSPFIEDTATSIDLLIASDPESFKKAQFDTRKREFLEKMINDDEHSFLKSFIRNYLGVGGELSEWLMADGAPTVPFINPNVTFAEAVVPSNVLISLPQLYEFSKAVNENPAEFENSTYFFERIRDCLWVVEVMQGHRNLETNS